MDAIENVELNAVCLQNAVLCADCEVISDSSHDVCRICGGHALLSLARVLGGTLPVQRAQVVEAREFNPERPVFALVHRAPPAQIQHSVA